ncbi:ankyrin repeat domain-containing protein [Jiangella aurantiaca]|uniref:ankyrin repeat domain-containing protein n=1 Tax=Jiangella aurantiaca TaxID=2530373 RepID=UPI0013A5D422|nr:ankyrin repeat domain-containing protein [Jiangella aurantiaca]
MTDWLRLVYAGDTIGGTHVARPAEAARWTALVDRSDPYFACAARDVDVVRGTAAADHGWVHRPGGPLGLPPLVAVTHSSLVRLPEFAAGLRDCARALLDAGADPDDGESLYHSLGDIECTRLLLAAGATVTGTNAMYAVADHDDADVLRLLLEHGGDPNEPSPSWGAPLLFAIRRRCSTAFVRLLLDAGADPRAVTPEGVGAYRLALRFGHPEVAELLHGSGAVEPLDLRELVVAACASGDAAAARRLLAAHPDVVATLDETQRRLLPDLAAAGATDAFRLMVEAGWPIDTVGGDWQATALNHAVFRGDAGLTRFLLEHGADPAVPHGFGDTVVGTLEWASRNGTEGPRDFDGCARALLDHGVELPADGRPRPQQGK